MGETEAGGNHNLACVGAKKTSETPKDATTQAEVQISKQFNAAKPELIDSPTGWKKIHTPLLFNVCLL